MQMNSHFDYEFSEISRDIIGTYHVSNWFNFHMHTEKAPAEGDRIKLGEDIYCVSCVADDTTDEEYSQGFSYSKIWLIKLINE